MACPAQSSECERVFSRVNLITPPGRISTSVALIEAEIQLHKWQGAGLIRITNDADGKPFNALDYIEEC